jgi:hypothetical protein
VGLRSDLIVAVISSPSFSIAVEKFAAGLRRGLLRVRLIAFVGFFLGG